MTSDNKCSHCSTDCGKNPFTWEEKIFCCNGCLQVYQLLHENQLYQYYNLSTLPGVRTDEIKYDNKYAFLDNEEIKEKLYEFHNAEIAKITFYIPSIHCISCIWLLEHINKLHSGIKQSSVNFVQKTFTATFSISEISLRQLVELLVSIHYIPDISLENFEKKNNKKENKGLIYKIGISGFIFGNVMLFSLPQYFNGKSLGGSLGLFFNYISFIMTIPVVFYCGSDYLISAWKGIKNKIINIDFPIALGIITLFIVTSFEVLSNTGQGYSDSLSGLLFFLLLGKWYQSKTYQALSFDRDYKSYFPIAVTKINNGEQSTLLKDIVVGDILLIRNKELIPADSELVSGYAYIDYSFVTGESIPVKKEPGEFLYAGGIQSQGAITIKIVNEINQSHLTSLWNQSTDNKKDTKFLLPIIDKISVYFTLSIIIIALSGFFWWWHTGNFRSAIMVLTSVLIITCPCALALSLPFTFGNAMRILGLKGVYIKNASVIEKLTKIDTVVFDKTGTITIPDESNVQFIGNKLTEKEIQFVASLAKQSTHPLSNAIEKYLNNTELSDVSGFVEVSGKGTFGIIKSVNIKIGSSEFIGQIPNDKINNASRVYLSIDNTYKGYFLVNNKYRPGFEEVITDLKQRFKIYLLSGDNDSEKENLKKYFAESELFFDQNPQDKMNFILELQKKGYKVLMTGDGLNDAGAFMQSNVAISVADDIYHFSPASEAIIEASSLQLLNKVIEYSKKSLQIVKISFSVSFFYNIIGLVFALSGTLSPVVGAILMPISSVSVVALATFGTSLLAQRIFR